MEGELRPGRVPGVPFAGLGCPLALPFRRGWGSSGALLPVPRPTRPGGMAPGTMHHPSVSQRSLSSGVSTGHDGRLIPAAAIIDVPRAFARRGPFENPDRVGHLSSIGVLSSLPSQTLASPRRTPSAFPARGSPNHSRFSRRRSRPPWRAGTSAARRPPDRARRWPSASRSSSTRCSRARGARRALVLVPTRELASQVHEVHRRAPGARPQAGRVHLRRHRLPRPGARTAQGRQHRGGLPGASRGPDRAGRRPARRRDDRRARRGGPHGRHGVPPRRAPPARPDGGEPPGPPLLGHHRARGGGDHPQLPAGPGQGRHRGHRGGQRGCGPPLLEGRSGRAGGHHGQVDRAATGRLSSSAAPSVAPTASSASSRPTACAPSPCTAIALRGSGSGHWTRSPRAKADALVATDVVARGIHVDACRAWSTSTRRLTTWTTCTGRAGRAGPGHTGTVVSLVTAEQHKDVHGVQRALGLEPGLLAPFSRRRRHQSAGGGGRSIPKTPELTGNGEVLQHARVVTGSWSTRAETTSSCTIRRSRGMPAGASRPGRRVEFTIGAGRRGRRGAAT